MTDNADYTPPKVWTWDKEGGGRFAIDTWSGIKDHEGAVRSAGRLRPA
jgi:hypothetical protein